MLDDLCRRLIDAAEARGWTVEESADVVAPRFRGNAEDSEAALPDHARGLMLGLYPVLVTLLVLSDRSEAATSLRAAHNQMTIARSYLESGQVLDAHIVFLATGPFCDDWVQLLDAIERDERVCRKLAWMPDPQKIDASFQTLVERSFLARPWAEVAKLTDAPLDQNEQLVETVLVEKGLGPLAARAWVQLASGDHDDPEALVEQLVDAMDKDAAAEDLAEKDA